MEVGHLKRSSSMTKSRLKVSSLRPTEWGSSPCFPRATAARTPDAGERCMFRPMTVPDLHHAWLLRITAERPEARLLRRWRRALSARRARWREGLEISLGGGLAARTPGGRRGG